MARKTIAKATATVAIVPELLEKLFASYEVRSTEGKPLTVFSLSHNKADRPICIYDHRPEVCRAAAGFEEVPNVETAQRLIDSFVADAAVKIVTSRIDAVDRPAINLHPVPDTCEVDHVLSGTLRRFPSDVPEFDKWSLQFPAGRRGKIFFRLRELPRPSESEDLAVISEKTTEEEPEDVNELMGFRKVVFHRGPPRRS
ncbi:MAG: hypothetical protein HZB55_18235 [Deltaproteobacteria bacterium]|nr:hypothetical protein [Deltaproteobacteria bacterium]